MGAERWRTGGAQGSGSPPAGSELLRNALGEHLMESFVQNKLIEWEAYRSAITDFELKRYLPVL